jgi:hypothetical protein
MLLVNLRDLEMEQWKLQGLDHWIHYKWFRLLLHMETL